MDRFNELAEKLDRIEQKDFKPNEELSNAVSEIDSHLSKLTLPAVKTVKKAKVTKKEEITSP